MKLRHLILLSALATAYAADAPYIGTWKANMAKSNLAGTSVSYEQLTSGEWKATSDGVSYQFKMDGNEYSDNMGGMASWKNLDAATWQTVWRVNGKLFSTDTLHVGADGLLTVATKGAKPNGEPIDDLTIYQRAFGGPGLAGKWKSKTSQSNSPRVMRLIANGDGIIWKNNFDVACDARLDGKEHPCAGPVTAHGWAVVVAKTGAAGLAVTFKKDGKPMYRSTYVVSADGKTMTSVGGAVATKETRKIVWDRQ